MLRFPQRNLSFEVVDYRWGISAEDIARSGIASLCLAAIDDCTPFFIGLLGDEYGTIPEIGDDEVASYPWLADCRGRSVTEIEIVHGCLNRQPHAGLFAQRRGPHSDPRMNDLAARVAATGVPFLREYSSLDQLLAFLELQIAAAVSALVAPQEASALEQFINLHNGGPAVGRTELIQEITSAAEHCSERIVWISGEVGSGKSAVLAAVCGSSRLIQSTPCCFLAASAKESSEDAIWDGFTDLLRQIDLDAPALPNSLRELLPVLTKVGLSLGSLDRRLFVIVDEPSTGWISEIAAYAEQIPQSVTLILSSRSRPPPTLRVRAFFVDLPSPSEGKAYLHWRLQSARRTLDADQVRIIGDAHVAKNYHALRIAFDELERSSQHDRLQSDVRHIADVADIGDLVREIANRIDRHLGTTDATEALVALHFSGIALTSSQLGQILGLPAYRTAVLLAALSCFVHTGVRIRLHPTYSAALELSDLVSDPLAKRRSLATLLVNGDAECVVEACHQYHVIGDNEALRAAVARLCNFEQFGGLERLVGPLRWSRRQQPIDDLLKSLALSRSADDAGLTALMSLATLCDHVAPHAQITTDLHEEIARREPQLLSETLRHQGWTALKGNQFARAFLLAKRAIIEAIRNGDHGRYPKYLGLLAAALGSLKRGRTSEVYLRAALQFQSAEQDPLERAALLSSLSAAYLETGRPALAVQTSAIAVALKREAANSSELVSGLHNHGSALLGDKRYVDAVGVLEEAYTLARMSSLPNRAQIAFTLLLAAIPLRLRLPNWIALLEADVLHDATLPMVDIVWFELTVADAWAALNNKSGALRSANSALVKAKRLSLQDNSRAAGLALEAEHRLKFLSASKNWHWRKGFRGWGDDTNAKDEPERIWLAFERVQDYSRFFFSKSSLVVSNGGELTLVVAKGFDALAKVISGVDLTQLQEGIGSPQDDTDLLFVYQNGSRYLALWAPLVPVNPLFVGALNAVVSELALDLDDTVEFGQHIGGADHWVEFLREMLIARAEWTTGVDPSRNWKRELIIDEETGAVSQSFGSGIQNRLCGYYPELSDFAIVKRKTYSSFTLMWLDKTTSASSLDYPRILWVELVEAMPIMFSRSGSALGQPTVVVAIEDGGVGMFLGKFTPDGHQTFGRWNNGFGAIALAEFDSFAERVCIEFLDELGQRFS